jgi:hypothetical protein
MPRFVAIEHWFAEAENFAEAYTLYDEGAFSAGGFVELLEVIDGDFYDEDGIKVSGE